MDPYHLASFLPTSSSGPFPFPRPCLPSMAASFHHPFQASHHPLLLQAWQLVVAVAHQVLYPLVELRRPGSLQLVADLAATVASLLRPCFAIKEKFLLFLFKL